MNQWESVPREAILALTELIICETYNECEIVTVINECVAMQCTYSLHRITRLCLNKSISLET